MDQNDYSTRDFNSLEFLNWVIGIAAIASFVISVLFLCIKPFDDIPIIELIFFYSAIECLHIFKVFRIATPKFEFDQASFRRAMLCQDLYMFILCLFLIISENTNYFIILDYAFNTFVEGGLFFVQVLAPIVTGEGPYVARLRTVLHTPYIPAISAVIEACTALSLLLTTMAHFSMLNLIVFLAYFFLVNIASLATTEAHNRLWSKVGLWLREFAAQRNDKLGQYIEVFVEKCSHYSTIAQQYFPKKDVKVHLQ